MAFDAAGVFKVGNTTLNSSFKVTIPAYDIALPEINSSSPVIMPITVSASIIINWLERGIYVEFADGASVAEKLLFFLLEYNRYALTENKNIKNASPPYIIAYNAQNMLTRMLNHVEVREKIRKEDEVPFKRRLYKGIPHSTENKALLAQKGSSGKGKTKESTALEDLHAYDIFAPQEDEEVPGDTNVFSTIAFDS
jgi:hypothetical protein